MVCKEVKIVDFDHENFQIKVQGKGEPFDLSKHEQGTEIKAITYVWELEACLVGCCAVFRRTLQGVQHRVNCQLEATRGWHPSLARVPLRSLNYKVL